MRELSLHILDVAQNSVTAHATLIELEIIEDHKNDLLTIIITDDGTGMDAETAKRVVDPFYTSRTTRSVGLGIPMFKSNAEQCNGSFVLDTQLGRGTKVLVKFQLSHIDRVPLGNMADTIMALVMSDERTDIKYIHQIDGRVFEFTTMEVKAVLGEDVSLGETDILLWIKEHIKEGINEIRK